MSAIKQHIGNKIKELRDSIELSQADLGKKLGVTANTVSRWESGIYEPKMEDLEEIARVFSKPIWVFFPAEIKPPKKELAALLSKVGDLPAQDLEELGRYSDFIRARSARSSRKGKGAEKHGNVEK